MTRRALLATVVVAVALTLTYFAQPSSSDGLVFSPATKVCQLTGEVDKQYDTPTYNRGRQSGVTGTDYGYPVPWNGQLLFMFGDSRSLDPDDVVDAAHARDELAKGYDAAATAPLNVDIARTGCVNLDFITKAPNKFRPLRLSEIREPPAPPASPRPLVIFETPVSGFARGNELLAFFTVRDKPPGCGRRDGCALGDEDHTAGGQAKLARADGNGTDFTELTVVSRAKFQWPVAVVADRRRVPGLPEVLAGVVLTNEVVLIVAPA